MLSRPPRDPPDAAQKKPLQTEVALLANYFAVPFSARGPCRALACIVGRERLACRSTTGLGETGLPGREITAWLKIAARAAAITRRSGTIAATIITAATATVTKAGLAAVAVSVAARRMATAIGRALHTLAIVKAAAVVAA